MDPLLSADRSDVRHRVGMQVRELLRLAPSVHARLARDIGIGVSDALALDNAMAAKPDTLGIRELAHRLGIRSASATVAVDRLVASGHMVRAAHPTDRRRTSLEPTATAYEDAWQAAGPLIVGIREAISRLDEDEAALVHRFLEDALATVHEFADSELAGAETDPLDDAADD